MTSHCTTAHIQQTSVHRNDTNNAQKSGGQLSTASSWTQSSKYLFKGNWSPVRLNMGNGNAQAAISLCIPTAPVPQDYCSALITLVTIVQNLQWMITKALN